MIKYFKELENREEQYLHLLEESMFKNHVLEIENLPPEFYQKYMNLFLRLLDLDVLWEKTLGSMQSTKFFNEELYTGYDFDLFYSDYMNGWGMDGYLTEEGKNRLDFLVEIVKGNTLKNDWYDELYNYVDAVVDLFLLNKRIRAWNKYAVRTFLKSTKVVAKYQGKLTEKEEKEIEEALEEIEKYTIKIPLKRYLPVDFKLPNAWYITTNKHLYNSMGKRGHKEANLYYPYYYTILRDKRNPNPKGYLNSIRKIRENGFITASDYEEYLNLIYEFPSVYPEEYYGFNTLAKIVYNHTGKRSYNPNLINVIVGIESAHAGIYEFFQELRKTSNDYERDLKRIRELDFNDMLVKCCGFHKVSSVLEKTITTSLVNYEEEFREYIKRGWKIDFIPPIIISEATHTIEEYPEDFLTIRKILKK